MSGDPVDGGPVDGGDLVAELVAAVGAGHVVPGAAAPASVTRDWTGRWSGRPRAVVRPADTAEVSAVLRTCARHGVPVITQGGNTGLVGGGVPLDGEVVLSTARLAGLGPVDPAASRVEAGAGSTLGEVQRAARDAGLDLGIDFAARDSATVGGVVATNAGGERVLRHGTTRDQVLGLEVVLADGSVVRRMAGLPKDNTGYDLVRLMVGSEGTLGVITRVLLRLVPRAPARVAALLGLESVGVALAVTAALRARLPGLDAVEFFEQAGLRLVLRHVPGAAAPFDRPHPVYLLVEVAGAAAWPLEEQLAEALAEVAERHPVGDAAIAAAPASDRLWRLREALGEVATLEAHGADPPGAPVKLDVAVPLDRLVEFGRRLPGVLAAVAPRAVPVVFGHLAEGNLHVNLLHADSEDSGDEGSGAVGSGGAVTGAVLALVAELGGSISAEHGIGRAKARWIGLTRSPADLAAMRAIKSALDPAGLLAPGRVLAAGPASDRPPPVRP